MITIEVKTLFNGNVGIRDKYIQQALETKDSLFLKGKKGLEGEIMTIPFNQIRKKIVGKSDEPVEDFYNKGITHYLYYFKWKSKRVQPPLL